MFGRVLNLTSSLTSVMVDSTRSQHADGRTRWALGMSETMLRATPEIGEQTARQIRGPYQDHPVCRGSTGAARMGTGTRATERKRRMPRVRYCVLEDQVVCISTGNDTWTSCRMPDERPQDGAHHHRRISVPRTDDKSRILRLLTFQIRKSSVSVSVSVSGERPGVCGWC
jgi:hypothetical protein